MTMMDDIFNDCGAENRLPTSRYPIQPEERSWGGLPTSKDFTLNKPSTGPEMTLFQRLVVVR